MVPGATNTPAPVLVVVAVVRNHTNDSHIVRAGVGEVRVPVVDPARPVHVSIPAVDPVGPPVVTGNPEGIGPVLVLRLLGLALLGVALLGLLLLGGTLLGGTLLVGTLLGLDFT